MKIVDVSTTVLLNPGIEPVQYGTSPKRPSVVSEVGRLFVHIKTDGGFEGLGVGQASPGVREVISNALRPLLIDADPMDIRQLWDDMFWLSRQFGSGGIGALAISAVDIGLWDLKAKALGLPLYKLIGAVRDSVPVYGSGGGTHLTKDELVAEAAGYVERGIPRVKIKVGKDFGRAEKEDIERVTAVRDAVGYDVALYVDANSAYHPKQAIYLAKEFEQSQVGWFEEPVLTEDVEGLARIVGATSIQIATGEQEYSVHGFRGLLSAAAVDIVQPDVFRVGGVTAWLRIAELAETFNRPVAPHLAPLVHLHLACTIPNLKSLEYRDIDMEADRGWYHDVPQLNGGTWSPFPDRLGLGLELDPYAVERWAV